MEGGYSAFYNPGGPGPTLSSQFSRIMISNTTLATAPGIQGWLGYPLFRLSIWRQGEVQELDYSSSGGFSFDFLEWVGYARHTDNFDFAGFIQHGTTPTLSDAELAGYAAPFPSNEYIAGPRIFPQMVATHLRQNTQVMENLYANWDKPLLTAFGSDDPLMAGRDEVWQTTVPGAQGQSHTIVEDASHFIQDDKPDEISRLLIEFINAN